MAEAFQRGQLEAWQRLRGGASEACSLTGFSWGKLIGVRLPALKHKVCYSFLVGAAKDKATAFLWGTQVVLQFLSGAS